MSKISELSDGGSLVSTDFLIAVRSGGNVKVQMDAINVDQVDLGDNEFIRLGNSQDLTLVHTSTQSIINQAGVGDLLLQKAGSTKLTINSTGIDVSGTLGATGVLTANAGVVVDTMTLDAAALTATGNFTVDAVGDIVLDADAGNVVFKDGGTEFGSVGNSSGSMFIEGLPSSGKVGLTFFGSSIEPRDGGSASNDAVDLGSSGARFRSLFLSNNISLTNATTSAFIQVSGNILQLGTSTADPVVFYANNAVALSLAADGAVVVNDDAADIDFRVESNNNANMLFVDGGGNAVVMGGSTPLAGSAATVYGSEIIASSTGEAGVYTQSFYVTFAANAAKYLRIQQSTEIYGGLEVTVTGDYANTNVIGAYKKAYSIGANVSSTTLFSPGNTVMYDLGTTADYITVGDATKPNSTTIHIPISSSVGTGVAVWLEVQFFGRAKGIASLDVIAQ